MFVINTIIAGKLDYFLSRYGVNYSAESSSIYFISGVITAQVDISNHDGEIEILLIQSIVCGESNIALRLSQCASFESIFGVVMNAFFLDNRLCLATVLPDDLNADEWITVFEHQKERLSSFLGK